MPTYEYLCPKGHQFELFQRITETPGAPCPECGEPAARQISRGAGFLFKGEGFYITDYRSADYKKKASAEPGAPAKPSTTSESSKPAGGSDTGKGSSSAGEP